jgi:hypothetical protein
MSNKPYHILQLYNRGIARESLSPQLSRLKNDEKVLELVGNNWVLVLPQNKEPPIWGDI